jgi:hypothetical protein
MYSTSLGDPNDPRSLDPWPEGPKPSHGAWLKVLGYDPYQWLIMIDNGYIIMVI